MDTTTTSNRGKRPYDSIDKEYDLKDAIRAGIAHQDRLHEECRTALIRESNLTVSQRRIHAQLDQLAHTTLEDDLFGHLVGVHARIQSELPAAMAAVHSLSQRMRAEKVRVEALQLDLAAL